MEEQARIARLAVRGAAPPAAIDPTAPSTASRMLGPRPLELTMARLAVEDEPILIARLLLDRSAQDIALLAQRGDHVAQHILGYMLHFGIGVERDLTSARAALEASAATGYAPGQLELGYFLLESNPSPADRIRAEQLHRAAADAGYSKAKTHLAERIVSGQFGPPDHAEVGRLYVEAADGGHPAAIYALTRYPEYRAEMMARLRRMADAGNPEGNNWICEAEFDEQRAAAVFEDCLLAARASFAGAMTIVARAYADGNGVPVDLSEAVHWARVARAQPELGAMVLRIADISTP